MQVFTSSLPDTLFALLSEKAQELNVPKNKIIEKALSLYLEQLNKAAYIKTYRQMAADTDILQLAEEGMAAYYKQINSLDKWNKVKFGWPTSTLHVGANKPAFGLYWFSAEIYSIPIHHS